MTINKIIFADNQGEGFILDDNEYMELQEMLDYSSIQLGDEVLTPGKEFDLNGHFKRKLTYRGQLSPGELVFYIGGDIELFGCRSYFQIIHKITDTRFFEMFHYQSGRDFNFVNGQWK